MRDLTQTQLDRVDELAVGAGMLEAYAFGRGTLDLGQVGAGVDYSHRLSEGLSAFANGEIGYDWGNREGLGWRALTGLRWRFE